MHIGNRNTLISVLVGVMNSYEDKFSQKKDLNIKVLMSTFDLTSFYIHFSFSVMAFKLLDLSHK